MTREGLISEHAGTRHRPRPRPRHRPRPPVPLVALMVLALLFSFTWTLVSPAFQAPDEQSHFAYAQSLGERFALPGAAERQPFSTEHRHAVEAVNADQVAGSLPTKPEWSEDLEQRWRRDAAGDPGDDGGGAQSASSYPPLSYLWESLGYRLFASGDFFDTLFGSRLFSALSLPITVLGTWLLAGELLGRRRLLQLAAAAVPALLPMPAFVSGSVSPDGMLYALWSLALWLGV